MSESGLQKYLGCGGYLTDNGTNTAGQAAWACECCSWTSNGYQLGNSRRGGTPGMYGQLWGYLAATS